MSLAPPVSLQQVIATPRINAPPYDLGGVSRLSRYIPIQALEDQSLEGAGGWPLLNAYTYMYELVATVVALSGFSQSLIQHSGSIPHLHT